MKPSGRRRIERAIRAIIEDDGDRCSRCKKPFEHNTKTYGGATSGGVVALVGDCCREEIKDFVTHGVYAKREYESVVPTRPSASDGIISNPADLTSAVEHLQQHLRVMDETAFDLVKRGGLPSRETRLHTAESPWKSDDAAWFKANPTRSHRCRAALPGEIEGMFGNSPVTELPPEHEFHVVVRQVIPGQRIRLVFGRNMTVPLPDDEPIIHALFDSVSVSNGGVINVGKVANLAKQYAQASAAKSREN